jgi:hypothetical protein
MKLQLVHFTGRLMMALEVEPGYNKSKNLNSKDEVNRKENVSLIRGLDEILFRLI